MVLYGFLKFPQRRKDSTPLHAHAGESSPHSAGAGTTASLDPTAQEKERGVDHRPVQDIRKGKGYAHQTTQSALQEQAAGVIKKNKGMIEPNTKNSTDVKQLPEMQTKRPVVSDLNQERTASRIINAPVKAIRNGDIHTSQPNVQERPIASTAKHRLPFEPTAVDVSRWQPGRSLQHSRSNPVHDNSNTTHRLETRPPDVGNRAATARISNIELSTTEEDMKTYLGSKGLTLADDTRISFVSTEAGYKLATVSFFDEEILIRALSLPRVERKLRNQTLNFDGGFEGFTVLVEGHPSEVDIVALHGMNGHAFNSWEYRDNSGYGFMWLRDHLPERIPNARIMVYGYNANLVSDVSTGRIRTYAETFLERLLQIRRRNPVVDRPLILIGHSLGGLIIKQALIIAKTRADNRFSSVLNSVGGVIFMGTPHRGLNGIDTATFVANFMGVFNVEVRRDLIAEQHPSSMVLFDLTNDFRELIAAKGIDIATLYETKKTKYGNESPVWIVDEQSAILSVAGERKASIDADHINLCKFEGSHDDSLAVTIQFIQEIYDDVVPVIAFRDAATQPSPPTGLKYCCFADPNKIGPISSYPVLVLGKYTYWALNHTDDRNAMAILAYDNSGREVGRWWKNGARSVHHIEYRELDGHYRQIHFVGQGNKSVVFQLAELKVKEAFSLRV